MNFFPISVETCSIPSRQTTTSSESDWNFMSSMLPSWKVATELYLLLASWIASCDMSIPNKWIVFLIKDVPHPIPHGMSRTALPLQNLLTHWYRQKNSDRYGFLRRIGRLIFPNNLIFPRTMRFWNPGSSGCARSDILVSLDSTWGWRNSWFTFAAKRDSNQFGQSKDEFVQLKFLCFFSSQLFLWLSFLLAQHEG